MYKEFSEKTHYQTKHANACKLSGKDIAKKGKQMEAVLAS